MSYNATLYSFKKRINSTKRPTGAEPQETFNCKLNNGSGLLEPEFIFDFRFILVNEPQNFNYAYIQEFNRYYYINDWYYINGLWKCKMTVDVLASWKTEIGNTSSYVYRANTGYSFSDFIDNNYPYTTEHETVNAYSVNNPFKTNITEGSYVLAICGQGGGTGGVTYIAMDPSEFTAFSSALFSSISWGSVTEISDGLLKALVNPLQYIQSVQWFPYGITAYTNAVLKHSLSFGFWNFSVNYMELSPGAGGTWITGTFTITPPRHPAYATYGREMYLPPATRYTAIVLPFGQWDIDPMDIVNCDYVEFTYIVDIITGQAFLLTGSHEFDGDSWHTHWFDSRQGRIGVPIAINQTTQDLLGAATSVVAGGAAIASGGATAVLGTIGAVTSAAERIASKSSTNGGQGNTAFYNLIPRIIGEFLMPSVRNYIEYGVPVFTTLQLSTISGYIQCKANFQGSCTESEERDINGYFESGFFYE